MKTYFKILISNSILVTALSVSSLAADDTAKIKGVMRNNFESIMNIQQYITDAERFRDPANRSTIEKNLDAMTGLQHSFSKAATGQEPGLEAISKLFSDYLNDTKQSFKSGANGEFLRNQLRTMTGFCLSCHTRVATDKSFDDMQKRVADLNLSSFQRAEFYAATRQFDKALETFDKVISTANMGEPGLIEFGRAVRNVLSITVRVKQDPKATFYFLEKISARGDIPEYFQRYISAWKKEAMVWMGEHKTAKNASAASLISKAQALVTKAQKAQLFAADPSADISFLRASNLAHEALQKEPHGKFRGEALYLLGTCYDALKDPLLWALDGLYFESCVRENPHTAIAKKCYSRYANKVYFGYSGSGGTFVPEDEIKKLGELRKLSE